MPAGTPRAVAVIGLVRNGEKSLAAAVQHIVGALPQHWRVRWHVVESDSDDGTLSVLQQLGASVPGFSHQSLGALRSRMPMRTERIAHCRNAGLEWLRGLQASEPVSHVLMADLDGVNNGLTTAALLSCWQRDDWDACTANQNGRYYDLWALRHPQWCPADCWQEADFLARHGVDVERARLSAVYSRMLHIAPDHDWIQVESAFGGLAVYRAQALEGLRYEGVTPDGQEVCEHVSLHAQLRARGGRIFINPALLNGRAGDDAQYWPALATGRAHGDSLRLRALLWLLFGRRQAKEIRRLLRAVL